MDLLSSSSEDEAAPRACLAPSVVYKPPSLPAYQRDKQSLASVFSSSSDDDDGQGNPSRPRPGPKRRRPTRSPSCSSGGSSGDDIFSISRHLRHSASTAVSKRPAPSSSTRVQPEGKMSAIQHLLSLNANALSLPVFQHMVPPPSPPRETSNVQRDAPPPAPVTATPKATTPPSPRDRTMPPPQPRGRTHVAASPSTNDAPLFMSQPRSPPASRPAYISPFGRQKVADLPPPPRRSLGTPPNPSKGKPFSDDDEWLSDIDEPADGDVLAAKPSAKAKRKDPLQLLSTRAAAAAPKRPRQQTPRSTTSPSLTLPTNASTTPDEIDIDLDQTWPQLPPPEDSTDVAPLVLQESEPAIQVHGRFNQFLLPYQREGVRWLFDAVRGNRGAILGDDMGLGKTVQMLALLSAVLLKQGTARSDKRRRNAPQDPNAPGPVLVVVPASLLANWELECKVWMCCNVAVLHGKVQHRREILDAMASRRAYEVVLCSYDVLKLHLDELRAVDWYIVVLDELHNLKNPDAQITKAVHRLPCKRKLGLSGTLMQNNADELHCVLDTIHPNCLGSLNEFRAFYIDDIKFARKKSAAPQAIARSQAKERQLRALLQPYYLHRDKTVNPQFTRIKKHDQVVLCPLTKLQRSVYVRVTSLPEYQALMDPDTKEVPPGPLWHHVHPTGDRCAQCPLNCIQFLAMTQLLKIANHLDLIRVNPADPPDQQAATKAFAKVAFGVDADEAGGLHRAAGLFDKMNLALCGKMQVLSGLLKRWRDKREKALVFSRNVRMLDILQAFVISQGLAYVRLDGGTKVDERLNLVHTFNQDPSLGVFLISTKAGGLGLNITSATNVVVFDPSWNPAHDCQAQDRAYRIGQTKDVHVYRLVTLGTIEEMIYARQIYKQHMADTTLEGKAMPRYFEAIQGVKSQQGELFGVKNLLEFQPQGVMKAIQDRKVARGGAPPTDPTDDDIVMVDTALELDPTQAVAAGGGPVDKDWQGVVEELALSQPIARQNPRDDEPPAKKPRNLYIPQYLQPKPETPQE